VKDSHNLKGAFSLKLSNYNGKESEKQRAVDSPSAKLKPSLSIPTLPHPFWGIPKGMGKQRKGKVMTKATNHRFENCGAFRAFLSPYFRRSLQRESLLRNLFFKELGKRAPGRKRARYPNQIASA
jgi:hypothetical protein